MSVTKIRVFLNKFKDPANKFIYLLILLNFVGSCLVPLHCVRESPAVWWLSMFFDVSTIIFVIEMAVRIFMNADRHGGWGFFVYGDDADEEERRNVFWNWFDLTITLLSVGSMILTYTLINGSRSIGMTRTIRVIRGVRMLGQGTRVIRQKDVLKNLLGELKEQFWTIVKSTWKVASTIFLLCFIVVIFANIGAVAFEDVSPEHFGSIWKTYFSLFQILTLDNWDLIARPIIEQNHFAAIYFVLFICIAAYIILNSVTGFIFDVIQHENGDDERDKQIAQLLRNQERILSELAELRGARADFLTSTPRCGG